MAGGAAWVAAHRWSSQEGAVWPPELSDWSDRQGFSGELGPSQHQNAENRLCNDKQTKPDRGHEKAPSQHALGKRGHRAR